MKYSSSNKPMQCMMTQSTCYNGTSKFTPKGILWHSTGANNPNLKRYVQPDDNASNRSELLEKIGTNKNKNDWNHVYRKAGLNCWIGKLADGSVTTLQTMPWDYAPWGCGAGSKGSCNSSHIQFEICEDALTDKNYFSKVYQEACEITAYLCKMFNIDPKGTVTVKGVQCPTILCHKDAHKLGLGSNHGDVYNWFNKHGKTMDDVRNDVAALLNTTAGTPVQTAPVATPVNDGEFKAGDVVKIVGSTYYNGKAVPNWVKAQNWVVYSVKGDRVVVNKNEKGTNAIMSPFNANSLAHANGTTTTTTATPVTKKEQLTGSASTGSAADKKMFHDYFMSKIGNEYGVAGLWGNIYAESGGRSNNLQNTAETKLMVTDAQYTESVDNDSYKNFAGDGFGYGLAQWTAKSRKQGLLNYTRAYSKSIGDYATQMEYLFKELSDGYSNVLSTLKSATSVQEASDAVLTKFEKPANQDENVKTKRANYAKQFYELFVTTPVQTQPETVQVQQVGISGCKPETVIAVAKAEVGYKEKLTNEQLDDKEANAGRNDYTKYARDFDEKYPRWYNGKKNGHAWCDVFVDWCFLTAYGYDDALKLLCQPEKSTGAACRYSLKFYKNKGQFYTNGPQPGDQIFFGASEAECHHTGIVEKADSKKVYTIEGNTGAMVNTRAYSLSDSTILGYGRPNYDGVTKTVTVSTSGTTSRKVRVTDPALNIRTGPGTSYAIVGCITDKGIYGISEEKKNWGKLTDGRGWISLYYTEPYNL